MLQSNERNSVAYFKNDNEKSELIDHANALINIGFNTIKYIIENSSDNGARKQSTKNLRVMAHTQSMARIRERSYERTRKR